jgi:Bacterial Ig-like domain (group 3)
MTTLTVPVQIPIQGLGVLVIADAQVTSVNDGTPVGSVQFTDGNGNNLGSPVPLVDSSGHAFFIALRPPGSKLTAVYIPAPGTRFTSSTSNTVTLRS